jgi:hypothetical protein
MAHGLRPQETSRLLRKTINRIRGAAVPDRDYFVRLVEQSADIEGIESVLRRIIQRDDQAMLDHLMEIKYGVLFKNLRFLPRFEPTGQKGPDLMVERDGLSAFVEVKRYRQKEEEHIPDHFGPHGTLQSYGDPRAQLRIEGDLLGKLRQIEPRDGIEHGILAIWSDREFFEEIEFECAVRQISAEAAHRSIRFCIYGSDSVSPYWTVCCVAVSQHVLFHGWMEDLRKARM